MKTFALHFKIGLTTIFAGVIFQAEAQGDAFFLTDITELYTFHYVGNREGDPSAYSYTTAIIQEITNSAFTVSHTVDNDISLDHVSVAARASYGYLFLAENADYTTGIYIPPDYDWVFGQPVAPSGAGWRDHITISNALLNGTLGYLRASIFHSGNLSAAVSGWPRGEGGDARVSLKLGCNSIQFIANYYLLCYLPYDGNSTDFLSQENSMTVNINSAALSASNGVANLDIPFVFGQPFHIYCHLSMHNPFSMPGASVPSSGMQQNNLQVQWQGAVVLDHSTNIVASFTLVSDSGTDWTAPQPIVAGTLRINGISSSSGTNLVITGVGGASSNQVYLLTSTNLAQPISNWIRLSTNTFDNVGHVSFTTGTAPDESQRYFRLLTQQ